jgi:hypothetical protein
MKRTDLLNALKNAGYHSDRAAWTRLVVENRVSVATAGGSYARGIEARKAGLRCNCGDCSTLKVAS